MLSVSKSRSKNSKTAIIARIRTTELLAEDRRAFLSFTILFLGIILRTNRSYQNT